MRIKNIIDRYAALSVLFKLLISSSIGILAGASFIGFISEYATYYYAISYGVRLPVEGVPYLSITITLISILILVSSITTFAILSLYFKLSDESIEKVLNYS